MYPHMIDVVSATLCFTNSSRAYNIMAQDIVDSVIPDVMTNVMSFTGSTLTQSTSINGRALVHD